MRTGPQAHILEDLVHSWLPVGRIRTCDLAGGGLSLEVGFEVLKAHTRPSLDTSASNFWIRGKLSATDCPGAMSASQVPRFCHGEHELTF